MTKRLRFFFIFYPLSCFLFFILYPLSHAPFRFEGIAMTIPYCLQIGTPLSQKEATAIEVLILNVFSEIHQIYNNWNPESEISKLNQLAANEKVSLSNSLNSFLLYVDKIVEFTEGRFDPTIEPLQKLWKKNLKEGSLPSLESLAELSATIGWKKIHIEKGLFWKEHSLTGIDLSGIAKGYAVDLLIEKLNAAGYQDIYVEWGGEIRTLGNHPDRRPWKIGIQGSSKIDLTNMAIATSGSYNQNWTIDTTNYTHILDPRTQQPIQNAPISSVSVLAPTCAEADGLATALMLFPSKDAAEKWALEKGLKVFITEKNAGYVYL